MRNPRILPAAVSMAVSMRVPYLSAFNARRIFVCDEATRRRAAHPKVTTMFRSFWTRSPPPLHRRFGSLSFEITDLKVVGRNGFSERYRGQRNELAVPPYWAKGLRYFPAQDRS